jgi:hypothetical protein
MAYSMAIFIAIRQIGGTTMISWFKRALWYTAVTISIIASSIEPVY